MADDNRKLIMEFGSEAVARLTELQRRLRVKDLEDIVLTALGVLEELAPMIEANGGSIVVLDDRPVSNGQPTHHLELYFEGFDPGAGGGLRNAA